MLRYPIGTSLAMRLNRNFTILFLGHVEGSFLPYTESQEDPRNQNHGAHRHNTNNKAGIASLQKSDDVDSAGPRP